MIQQILLAIWRRLTVFIDGLLNPDWKAKAEENERRAQEIEAGHKALDAAELALAERAAKSVERDKELQLKIDEINRAIDSKEQVLAELRRQDKEIDDALVAAKSSIDQKTDAEKVRLDL